MPSLELSNHILACMVMIFVTNAVTCAVVRWFHVCPCYRDRVNYHFPARLRVTVNFLMCLTVLPFILNANRYDANTWIFYWGLLFYPITATQTIEQFFGHLSHPLLYKIESVVYFSILIALTLIAFCDLDITLNHRVWFDAVVIYLVIHSLFRFTRTMRWVRQRYMKSQEEYLSNPDDFSLRFVHLVFYIPILALVLWAISAWWENDWYTAFLFALGTITQTWLLLRIMHPQRGPQYRKEVEMACRERHQTEDAEEEELTDTRTQEIVARIEELMDRKLYLHPRLTVAELAKEAGWSVTEVRRVCHQEYGSFFHLINGYRIRYSQQLAANNPSMTRDQIATESGFGSYRSLLRAEEKYFGEEEEE